MRVVFMGTPDFSVSALKRLIETNEVEAVFTQPDKPRGRGHKLQYPPVKEVALKYNIPVYQPKKLKYDEESLKVLKTINPEVIVVVAYGQILPKEILNIPEYGCINVHASLLPELRGAAPINWAIIRGHKKTGVTTMLMNEGLDTGDMLLKEEVDIKENETAGELHDRLMIIGAEILIDTISRLENNTLKGQKQDDSVSSYAPMLNKDLGHINWENDSENIYNLIRGVTPWPGAYCCYKDKILKLWLAVKGNGKVKETPGRIVSVNKQGIEVACKSGSIIIKEIQELGSKRMDIPSYLNGHDLETGEILK